MVDDTVFGQNFKSEFPDIAMWNVNANAIYKGYSGYAVVIKKTGTSTLMTAEPCSLVSGKTYQVTSATKRLFDQSAATMNVFDNGVNQNANVLSIDYQWGRVTFASGYTVTGPVTITTNYFPLSQICSMNKYSLTQSAEAVDNTDLCVAQANSGLRQYAIGLKTVGLELSGFYTTAAANRAALLARSRVVIEINPDGAGLSVARGWFTLKSAKQSGKVGALEDETLQYSLFVPDKTLQVSPFSWQHAAGTTLNTAIQTALNAWQNDAVVECRYLPDGVAGIQGSLIPTNVSLQGGLGQLNEFSFQGRGTGAITTV